MRFYFELKIRTICIKFSRSERTQQVLKEYKGIDIQHLDQDRLQEFQVTTMRMKFTVHLFTQKINAIFRLMYDIPFSISLLLILILFSCLFPPSLRQQSLSTPRTLY